MKILLAEDDKNISIIMTLTLEQIGQHKVTLVEDGQAALEAVKDDHFDLIILDGMMPKLDGFSTCKKLIEDQVTTPIIFLSARSDEKSKESVLNMGAIGFIEKPFDPNLICDEIENLLKAS